MTGSRRQCSLSGSRGFDSGLAFAAVLIVTGLLNLDSLLRPEPRSDERYFVEAGRFLAQGESPYRQPIFNYPPPIAQLGAWATRRRLEAELWLSLRLLNLSAAVGLAWLAAGKLSCGNRLAVRGVVALLAANSPVVQHAFFFGNLSPLVAFLAIAGFEREERRPWQASLLLGASIALKPLALIGALFLYLHRALAPLRRFPAPGAWGWAVVAGLLLLPGWRFLSEMLVRMNHPPGDPHQLSLLRLARAAPGWEMSPTWVAAGVLGAAVLCLRRHALTPQEVALVAPVVSLLALPIVWAHSMVLTLPLQLRALDLAWSRFRSRVHPGRRTFWELSGVGLAVAAIQGSAAAGALAGSLASFAAALLPTLAPVALAGYLLRAERKRPVRGESGGSESS